MAVQRQRQCSVQTRRPSKLAQGRFIARPEELGTPVPPLGKLILKLKSEDLNDVSGGLETVASITNKSLVASFNWLDGDNSIILVPGRFKYAYLESLQLFNSSSIFSYLL